MYRDRIRDFTNTSTYPECRDIRCQDNECRLYIYNYICHVWYMLHRDSSYACLLEIITLYVYLFKETTLNPFSHLRTPIFLFYIRA